MCFKLHLHHIGSLLTLNAVIVLSFSLKLSSFISHTMTSVTFSHARPRATTQMPSRRDFTKVFR